MQITVWGNELSAWASAAVLAQHGNQVALSGSDPTCNLREPGLPALVSQQIDAGRLRIVAAEDALGAEVHLLCISPELQDAAFAIARSIASRALPTVLINQSNLGIGATDDLAALLGASQTAAYVPDNTPEGKALEHLKNLPSLIIGSADPSAQSKTRAVFRPLLADPQKVVCMSSQEAEFSKFAVAGMLALRIGYINELANLADELGVDIEPIRHAMTLDSRISPEYLNPGCGFGGLHFSQYISGLADILSEERRSTLLNSVLEQNERQKETPFRKLWRYYKGDLRGKTVAIWGLAFKPNTPSMDNAPARKIVEALLAQGVQVQAQDPLATGAAREIYADTQGLELFDNAYEALENADALILVTEWREYASPDFERMAALMKGKLIIDGRNLLDKNQAQSAGFDYLGIGR